MVGALEAEGAECVEQAVRVLDVHVVPGGAGLAVTALKKQDFLSDPGSDCRGEAALAGRDAGEALGVGPAGVKDAPEGVAEHLPREGEIGGDGGAPGPVAEAGEEGRAVRAAGRRARGFLAVVGHAEALLGLDMGAGAPANGNVP